VIDAVQYVEGVQEPEPVLPMTAIQRRFENQRGEPGSDDEGVLLWAMLDELD
jgi:hypothetical protein